MIVCLSVGLDHLTILYSTCRKYPVKDTKPVKSSLTLSSIYSFKYIEEQSLRKTLWEKGEIDQNEQFHLFPQCYLCNLYLKIL